MDEATALTAMPQAADGHTDPREVPHAGLDVVDLDALVARHAEPIGRLVSRLVDRPQDVEDLVQETFLAAIVHRRTFRGECRPETWLARIAVNRCRSHHRWRRVRRLVRWTAGDELIESAAGSDETAEEVRRAVRRLSVKYREAIVLRYFEQLEIDEVAEVLELSRTAVEKRLSRARQRLKDILGPRLE